MIGSSALALALVATAIGGPEGTSFAAATGNSWATAGSLDNAVIEPAVVTLADGRVLMLGGTTQYESSTDAWLGIPEIYDPVTSQWTRTATPPWAPHVLDGIWATLLQDGTVLVGGGFESGSPGFINSAVYVYDPTGGTGGTWTATTAPPIGAGGIATTLHDGHVLVEAGGSALDYDPVAKSWSFRIPMPDEIAPTKMLTLADGRVFVVSGAQTGATLGGDFFYDPYTDSWTTGPVATGGFGAEAVQLPDGRILTGGGLIVSCCDEHESGSFVLIDPATMTYQPVASLSTTRYAFALQRLPTGLILLAGGISNGVPTSNVQLFDPAANKWYPAASLPEAHAGPGSRLLADGRVLVAGGDTKATVLYTAGADVYAPAVGAPAAALRSSTTMGSTLPARLTWTAADSGGSGLATYDVRRSVNGAAYATLASGLASPLLNVSLAPGSTYRFQVRGHDHAGNVSGWATSSLLRPTLTQQSSTAVHYYKAWTTAYSTSYSGGSARYTTTAGAWTQLTFTGRSVAFVTRKGSGRSRVKIYLDGVLWPTTYDTYSASSIYRYVLFNRTWTTSGTHTIKVVNLATSGRPRFEIDAFEVIG